MTRTGSHLDLLRDEAKSLSNKLSKADKHKLDQYLTSVREVEQDVERTAAWLKVPPAKVNATGLKLDADHNAPDALIRTMLRLPELVEQIARTLEPHHLPHYTMELATAFHWFYENCRVVSSKPEDGDITKARLKLVESAQIVFRQSLELMGMSAPDRM